MISNINNKLYFHQIVVISLMSFRSYYWDIHNIPFGSLYNTLIVELEYKMVTYVPVNITMIVMHLG